MKRAKTILFYLAGGLTLTAILSAKASTLTDNPYMAIARRNVFALQAVVLSHDQAPPVAPPPEISLTGIMTILGTPEALFKMSRVIGKPAEFYTLGEGETQDDVKVMHIDMKNGWVTFNDHGVIQKISLADVAVKSLR